MTLPTAAFVVHSSLKIPTTQYLPVNTPLNLSDVDDRSSLPSGASPGEETSISIMEGWGKNVNVYWAITTILAIWFLFVHTPIFWKQRLLLAVSDNLLAIHIVAAGTIYIACAHNCLVTPSLSSTAKGAHTWIGRLGLVSGIVSFGLGAYLAWSRLTTDSTVVGGTTLGFAIPITIGGMLQIICEIVGFRSIRKYKSLKYQANEMAVGYSTPEDRKALETKQHSALCHHVGYMLNLFVMACSIPAGIRLAELVTGGKDGVSTTLAVVAVVMCLQSIGSRYVGRMLPRPPTQEEEPLIQTKNTSNLPGES